MQADPLAQLSQIAPLIVGSVAICVALFNQRRQLNAQMFIEFSGRFQNLMRLFPTEAWLANRNPAQPLPPSTQELTDCTLYCMQLIADVYHLHEAGYVSKRLWRLWEREVRNTLRGPVFRREWAGVSVEFSHDCEFLHYIDALMQERRPRQNNVGGTAAGS